MSDMDKMLIIVTTSDNRDELDAIGTAVVKSRAAACAQVNGPITSHYIWEGKKETSTEWQLKIKTLESRYNDVEKIIKEMHSYEVPQIVAIPVTKGSSEFMEWIKNSVST